MISEPSPSKTGRSGLVDSRRFLLTNKAILDRRSINIDDLKVDEYTRPDHEVYHLRPTDFDHDGKIKALSDIPLETLQDPRYINEGEGEGEEEEAKGPGSYGYHQEEIKHNFDEPDDRFRRNLLGQGEPGRGQEDEGGKDGEGKAQKEIIHTKELSDERSTDRNEGSHSSNSKDQVYDRREARNLREDRLETDQRDDLDDDGSFERTEVGKRKDPPKRKKRKIKQIKLKNISKDPDFKENHRQGNIRGNVGEDFKGTGKVVRKISDQNSKEIDENRTISEQIPMKKVRTQVPDAQRKHQLHSLATSGSYFTQNTEKFDLVIEHNDNDFNNISDEEGPSTPKKRKPEPMPKEYQLLNTETKVIKRNSRTDLKAPRRVNKEKSESPIQRREVNSNQHLLSEWEKKYGTKNDRKFFKDQETDLNHWNGGSAVNIPKAEGNQKSDSESPKGGVQITGDIKGEFEYDWDNEDVTGVNEKKKARAKCKLPTRTSRVPLGAMEYADATYNN